MANLQLLTVLKISILSNCYGLVALASLFYSKKWKTPLANELALIIALWLPIKKDNNRYVQFMAYSWA